MTKGIEVKSIGRLGINLTVNDVAKTLYKLSTSSNRKIKGIHYSVGLPAKVFQTLAQVTPDPIIRFVNRKIGG